MKRVLIILCIILVITAIGGALTVWWFSQSRTPSVISDQNSNDVEQPTVPINSESNDNDSEIANFDTNDYLDEAFTDLNSIDTVLNQ